MTTCPQLKHVVNGLRDIYMPPNERIPFPKEQIMDKIFYPLDLLIQLWQQLLILLVNHPWLPMIALPIAMLVNTAIIKIDKIRYPDS
jgi:hypothetical protein